MSSSKVPSYYFNRYSALDREAPVPAVSRPDRDVDVHVRAKVNKGRRVRVRVHVEVGGKGKKQEEALPSEEANAEEPSMLELPTAEEEPLPPYHSRPLTLPPYSRLLTPVTGQSSGMLEKSPRRSFMSKSVSLTPPSSMLSNRPLSRTPSMISRTYSGNDMITAAPSRTLLAPSKAVSTRRGSSCAGAKIHVRAQGENGKLTEVKAAGRNRAGTRIKTADGTEIEVEAE